MNKKFIKELGAMFNELIKKGGGKLTLKDMALYLTIRYFNRVGDREDKILAKFFDEHIISKETFNAIIEGINNLPTIDVEDFQEAVSTDESEKNIINFADPLASKVLGQASEECEIYPIGGDNLIHSSHIYLAILKLEELKDCFDKLGINYGIFQDIMKNDKNVDTSEDAIKDFCKMLERNFTDKESGKKKGKMNIMDLLPPGIFPPLFRPKKDEEDDDEDEDDDDEEENFNPGKIFENVGFPGMQKKTDSKKSKTPMLDKYAKDITKEALKGDKIFGRESEISQLLEILNCKKKNNAILLGEAGVGKTAVIELLAQKIAEGKVPERFKTKRILSLDLNSLVAGTKYRGQYEERLKGIIEEVTSNKDIIVYIDEIHNLVGNGSSEGHGDGANILKPYLARGVFQCIGSTTYKEYRKFIEKDSALKRRFQNVKVDEPDQKETLKILTGIKKIYEQHHGVTYPKEVLEACVSVSGRYITDRNFPDKAIDALDLSGSLAKLRKSETIPENLAGIREALKEAEEEKVRCVKSGDFVGLDVACKKYLELEKEEKEALETNNKVDVTIQDVYEAVGKRTSIPLDKIGGTELDKLRVLNGVLKKVIIGQDDAVKEIVMSLQRNSLGLRDPKKPIASLLFVGPTGSGKTYLCKTLAKEFFGSEDSLIKFDMSEFGEKHEITKLTGASASFVGYDDEPLFEQVRKKPYSVILFDEIEKAAPEIFQIFLSILDEGTVTLSNGTKVNFKNTIIIFTGNIGTTDLALYGNGIGYGSEGQISEEKKNSIIGKAIKKTFAPEFINRLTKTVIFHNLTRENMVKICNLEIAELAKRLKTQHYKLSVSKGVKDLIIDACDLKFGARDLQRNVTKFIEEKICEKLLDTPDTTLKNISVDNEEKEVKVELS